MDLSQPILACVTGASRGIGRQIAIQLATKAHADSVFILLATDSKKLAETKTKMLEANPVVRHIFVSAVDLSNASWTALDEILGSAAAAIPTRVSVALLVQNAGTLGTMKPVLELTDASEWRKHLDINVTSACLVNSAFAGNLRDKADRMAIVNISSLCGRTPFKDLAMYGATKAARELCFKVLALENPRLRVLNYSPGPVETDMYGQVAEGAHTGDVRRQFAEGRAAALSPEQTVHKLIAILARDDYKSGTVVDYFDDTYELCD